MFTKILTVAILITVMAGSANAMPFDISGPPLQDVDTNPPSSAFLNAPNLGIITDINVEVELSANYAGEVEIDLIHDGTTVVLHPIHASSATSALHIVFDDEAANPHNASDTGTFQPVGSLSDFDGVSLNGLWELRIFEFGIFDGTDLLNWRISGTVDPIPEPAGLGLMGLALLAMRKRR